MNNQRYVQLVSPGGKVLAQRLYSGQPLTHYQNRVWRVPPRHKIRVVKDTKVVQPDKFMQPVDKQADVFIYPLEHSIENLPKEPCRSLAVLKLKAFKLESLSSEFAKLIGGWNAFVNREWVGTSEY